MTKEGFNFSAGPAMLPESVLLALQEANVNCENSGYSVFELGHRTSTFMAILEEAQRRLRGLLSIPDDFDILFVPGGASLQFSAVALNMCTRGCHGAYILTGLWSRLAYEEANRISRALILWNGDPTRLPRDPIVLPRGTDYVYYCDNETVDGKEFSSLPPVVEKGQSFFVSDVSSNFLTKYIDWALHDCVFASLQKNVGIAGACVVIVRRSCYSSIGEQVPQLLNWKSVAEANSVLNTPPTVAIYATLLMLRWLEKEGGVDQMAKRATLRSERLYDVLDSYPEFYLTDVQAVARSRMNVVFHLPTEPLTELFLAEAQSHGLYNLKGHRSRGGIRASLYNAMPMAGAEALASFMQEFAQQHDH